MTNRRTRETLRPMRFGQATRGVLVCGFVAVAAASATAPGKHNVKTTANVAHGVDATWSAVIDVFADHGWSISNMEKASGLITTDWMSLGSEEMKAVDCGSEGVSSIMATQVRFNVRVKGDDQASSVSVNAKFRQERRFDKTTSIIDCASTGLVEAGIQRAVQAGAASHRGAVKAPVPVAVTVVAARGWYCATAPSAGFCVRDKAECQRTRDVSIGALPDLTECALTEKAWCTGDLCFPGQEACDARRTRTGIEVPCEERE